MTMWPELRSAYNTRTGRELAREPLDVFLGFVLEYSINSSDTAPQKREAIFAVMYNEPVAGAGFDSQAASMYDDLDQLEQQLRKGVE
jgi:hypothetical protein